MIPVIPIEKALAGSADEAVMAGATASGFLTISGVDEALGLGEIRDRMLGFFAAGDAAKARTIRHKFDPTRPNVYRGFFPVEREKNGLLEGFDIGPDIADPARAGDGGDPLIEPTPRPGVEGWNEAAAIYHHAMRQLGAALTRSILRGLGADDGLVDRLFDRSISTLRLLRYPPHEEAAFGPDRRIETPEGLRYLMTKSHTDSGFVTLLWQDGTGGLQAEGPAGWIDVPPAPGGLVVNFGQMLGDWSGGRVVATRHRVIGGLAERFSVPFFYEPNVDARIEPLTGEGEAFVYGDFLWERMQIFPNMTGIERRPAA